MLSAPWLNAFETEGSGNTNGQGKISDKDKMELAIDGSGDIRARDCHAATAKVLIPGSGDADSFAADFTERGDIRQ
ncbi:MAG: DUF2807 domain-containing protein [Bacteroidota bacterium]